MPTTSVWSDLPRRLATICIGVPLLWALWWREEGRLVFWVGLQAGLAYEWCRLSGGSSWFVLSTFVPISYIPVVVAVEQLSGSAAVVEGYLLVSVPLAAWRHTSFRETAGLLLTVWNGDTGALLTGRLVKRKTRPAWLQRVSPNKSVEGIVGGMVGATVTYLLLPWLWEWVPSPDEGGSLPAPTLHDALLLAVSAQLGDLWESSLKRKYGVKDTGKLLPGHGGLLDRFDSSLLAILVYTTTIAP